MSNLKNGNLGDADGFSDVGNVDMFGLDEFGEPAGGDSLWGAVIGGGVGTVGAILTRAMTAPTSKVHSYAEALGGVAGAVAGGVMIAFPGTRRMGWAALATALVTNGLRQMEQSFFPGSAGSTTAAPSGWGGVVIDPTAVIRPGQGFGIHAIEPGYAVQGGFGAPVIDAAYPVPGSIHGGGGAGFGMNRSDMIGPPTLVGAGDYGMGDNPGVAQTKLLGGPSVSALGAHYGATLFGGQS
jgi:hypothetical protein